MRRMMAAMVHRGPDDEGFERFSLAGEATVGFGFRRLAILDLSPAGHQPMVNEVTGDCLVFNGEIYNYRSLRAKLRLAGVELRSTGDTEVLLKALSTWGEKALDDLDGMFAFAFFHAASRRVLLARDHLGIKPLYVSRVGNRIVFASEVRAVLSSGLVPFDLDPAGVAGFLAYGSPQDPRTVHAHVSSMPAGSYQWIDAGSLGHSPRPPVRYWAFPSVRRDAIGKRDFIPEMRKLFDDTVAEQCLADVQVGAFLSGGIDSAVVSALAQRHARDLHTFCVGYENVGVADETVAAAHSAAAIGSRHFQTILDDDWVMLQWRQWQLAADRPSVDGLNTYIVSGAVHDGGATVALSGLGADELFGGYPQFWTVPRMYRYLAPFAWLPKPLRRGAAGLLFLPLRKTRRERACDMVGNCDTPLDLLLRMRRVFMNDELHALGLPFARLGLMENYLQPDIYKDVIHDSADTFHAISKAESLLYMQNTLLRDADNTSMAHSLEVRVPFLGRRFVEAVASLPGAVHAPANQVPKRVLRNIARELLPDEVFSRAKTGFSLPIGDWMFGRLREECESAIDAADACGLFEPGSVRRRWDYFAGHRAGIHWSRPLCLVVFGEYLKQMKSIEARIGAQDSLGGKPS